jgi:hypothetical protein
MNQEDDNQRRKTHVIGDGWNSTNPHSIVADRKMGVGVKDEMVEEAHIS